jgi:hypothetical protein
MFLVVATAVITRGGDQGDTLRNGLGELPIGHKYIIVTLRLRVTCVAWHDGERVLTSSTRLRENSILLQMKSKCSVARSIVSYKQP